MIFPIAQITEMVPMIDRASEASNRWLFLASIVVLMVGGALVIKWLVAALAKKDLDTTAALAKKDEEAAKERADLHNEIKSERAECRTQRKDDQAQFLSALAEKSATLATHTKAIEALTAVVTKHDLDMRAAHEIELRSLIQSEMRKAQT